MQIQSLIKNNSIKLLSGLANNNDSIASMAVKDLISDCAIVNTYKKEGTKDDVRERAIEEFGTGAVWLFGIPVIKKAFDKFVYPIFKLDSDLDIRVLNDKNFDNLKNKLLNSKNPFLNHQKEVFSSFDVNKNKYLGLFLAKFLLSTSLSAFFLSKIIKYKQKTTEKRIEKEYKQNNASRVLLSGNIKKQPYSNKFNSSSNIPFKGVGSFFADFMFNPIKNTAILDGVITGTRLFEARKGEKKEVALKEGFQILFIYALAKPIQEVFEHVANKFNRPIELSPNLLFSKNLKNDIENSKNTITSLKNSNKIIDKLYDLDVKSPLVKLLDKEGVISTIKNKNGEIEAISYFKPVSEKAVKNALSNIEKLSNNISKLNSIKALKVFAVLGNVAIASWAMGVLQPKLNILMRKILNNGDNRNPAIVACENELKNNSKLQ